MPLSKYLLYCHATVSVRLLVGCRRLEQIVPHMNVQQSHPFRSHLNPNEICYEPDIYGIQQIDLVDEETLLLFTSKTDKACLRDLFDSHCFMGEAEKQVHEFCFL